MVPDSVSRLFHLRRPGSRTTLPSLWLPAPSVGLLPLLSSLLLSWPSLLPWTFLSSGHSYKRYQPVSWFCSSPPSSSGPSPLCSASRSISSHHDCKTRSTGIKQIPQMTRNMAFCKFIWRWCLRRWTQDTSFLLILIFFPLDTYVKRISNT